MNELEQRIHAFLLVSPNSNAKLIARAIGEDVSTVNRCLYENSKKGTFFKSVGDTPPHWNCLEPDAGSVSINMQVDGQDTFNMTNLHFFENRIKTIRSHFRHSNTGYGNRGQISPDASVDDVATYAPLGIAHANELQQTLEDLKKFVPNELHVLEIGCGMALSRAVFKDGDLSISSFHGYDINEQMLWYAKRIVEGGYFYDELDRVPEIKGDGLLLLNHVFGQDTVAASHISTWVRNISRVFPNGCLFLSIEPERYAPSNQGFGVFREELRKSKIRFRVNSEYTIPSQHKGRKMVRNWSLSV
jgi:hypothetical protein